VNNVMKVEDLNKSKAYKKLNMSDVEKSELLEMCKSKKKELKSEIPDLSIRRTEKVNKDDKNSIIKKVVFAAGSIVATITIVAGVAKYNGGKNIGKETGKVASTNTETEVSSEMTTKSTKDDVKNNKDSYLIDWAKEYLKEISKDCYDDNGKLKAGYEEKTFTNEEGESLTIVGKDFIEVEGESDKWAYDVGKRRVYFIAGDFAYRIQMDVVLSNKKDDNISYYKDDNRYCYTLPGKDTMCPLIDAEASGLAWSGGELGGVEELKYDKKHKKVYVMSEIDSIDKDEIDENNAWTIGAQHRGNETYRVANLRIFDENSKVKTKISAVKCFYDFKKHSLIYLSEERDLYELMGIDMKECSDDKVEFVANDKFEVIHRLEGVCNFDVNEFRTLEIAAVEGEYKKVNDKGIKMELDKDMADLFEYIH